MFNFVFFATEYDWYPYMYMEILEQKKIIFFKAVEEIFNDSELLIYRSANREDYSFLYERALKRISFDNLQPVCFVHFSRFLSNMKNGLLIAEQHIFPECKKVHYFTDSRHITNDNVSFLLKNVDEIGVYDPNIANICKFRFWPNSFPNVTFQSINPEYDICFVGYGLGRTRTITDIVLLCKKVGLKFAVYIMEPDSDVERIEEIHYISELIPYREYLDILSKSNCVLELERKNDFHACSLRVLEAVVLKKKILTDNAFVFNMPCCSGRKGNIQVFKSVSEIDTNFFKERDVVDYEYAGEYSSVLFLERIALCLK